MAVPPYDFITVSPRHAGVLERGVRGGSDDDTGDAPAASPVGGAIPPAPPAGDAPPTPTTPPPAPPKAGEAPDAPAKPPAPSEYEVRLRDEVAGYRRSFEPYEKAFGKLPPEMRDAVLALGPMIQAQDDDSVRAHIAEVFGLQLPPDAVDPRQAPVTQAQLAEWQETQARQAQQAQAVEGLKTEAKALGIEHNTPAWHTLMAIMGERLHQASLDPTVEPYSVEEAVKVMLEPLEQFGQARVDEFVKGKGGGVRPAVAGAAPEGAADIKTFDDATKAAMAAIGASPG